MRWCYYDVTDGARTWPRRRRMTVPSVGETSQGYVVVQVDAIEGRADHVVALVHVRRVAEQR